MTSPGFARPEGPKAGTIATEFTAVAYPNPFAESFAINVKTSMESPINVKVYDMTGRLLESREVAVSDAETLAIGERYPSGVYNVIVTQGDEAKTLRVIKR
ncbi:MAG: T9SS type A sorting domain-containing protein [Flavobacterium sp.]|nr:MAG: T9SS type A sorting domain-containing protein [Flavobacterium sp.]